MFLGTFAWSFVFVSLPFYIETIAHGDAASTLRWTGWILGISPLVTVLTAPLWGRYAERRRPRRLYVAVQAFQGVAFFGMVVATTLPGLFLARLLLGVMGAASTFAFMMAGRSGDAFTVRRQVAAIHSGMPIGQVIGPLAGALIAARIGFRPSFVVGALILLGCAALVGWLAPEPVDARPRRDAPAGVRLGDLVTVGLIVLGANIHVFFLPAILPRVLVSLGVAPAATLEIGGLVIFASGVAAALGAVLTPRLGDLGTDRVVIASLLTASSLCLAALAVPRSVWGYGALRFFQVLFITPVFPLVVARIAQHGSGQVIGAINSARNCRRIPRAGDGDDDARLGTGVGGVRDPGGPGPGLRAAGAGSRHASGERVLMAQGFTSRPLVDIRLEEMQTATGTPPFLESISLHVRYGEFFTFVGPPHSGKTAILRAIAGFLPLSGGRVIVDAEDIAHLPAARRGIGYVFHQGALWPHLDARAHVAFALDLAGVGRDDMAERIEPAVRRPGLAEVAGRKPDDLTLEQRRRLALARALAVEPRVLLLDEPLAHLDPGARKTLRLEVARLHRDLAVTTICATRDAADALALSDRIGVVENGRLLQVGDPEQLYRRPASHAVAQALGPANYLPVKVVEVREIGVVVATEAGDRVPVAGIAFRQGSPGVLVLRPETLSIVDAAMARGPSIPGTVSLRVFEGARYLYEIDIRTGTPVRVELPATDTAIFRVGDRVRVEVSSDTVVLLPADT